MGERSPETLVVGEANRDAAMLLTEWKTWPRGALALVGPQGSGKTHIAIAWALEAGARHLPAGAGAEEGAATFRESGGRIVIDDAHGERDEAMLWRLLDLAAAQGGAVLLVGATPPATWTVALPDLRSRLAALPVALLQEPDEALMGVVLQRICRELFIQLTDDAARYLVRRLPRTFAAARAWAAALDQELVRGARPVSIAGARRALQKARLSRGAGDV